MHHVRGTKYRAVIRRAALANPAGPFLDFLWRAEREEFLCADGCTQRDVSAVLLVNRLKIHALGLDGMKNVEPHLDDVRDDRRDVPTTVKEELHFGMLPTHAFENLTPAGLDGTPPQLGVDLHPGLHAGVIIKTQHIDAGRGRFEGKPLGVVYDFGDDRLGQGNVGEEVHHEPLHAPQPPGPFVDAPSVAEDGIAARVIALRQFLRRACFDTRCGKRVYVGNRFRSCQRRKRPLIRSGGASRPMANAPLVEGGPRHHRVVQGRGIISPEARLQGNRSEVVIEILLGLAATRLPFKPFEYWRREPGNAADVQGEWDPVAPAGSQYSVEVLVAGCLHGGSTIHIANK